MKKIIPFLVCMLVALFACEKDTPTPPASIDSMQFDTSMLTRYDEGESINLSQYLTITPEAVGDTVTVDWSSSDEEIAIVSASGSVEFLRAGSVTITAKAMDKTAQAKLTIEKVKIKEFTIPATLEVYVGEKIKFPINDLKPKNAPLYRFEWEADNDGKEPTYSEGKWYLKADKEREYTLTASVDDAEDAKCNVKFVKPSVSKLAFNPASYTVEAESSLSLKTNLVITPADGMDADTIKVTWSSSKESVATIDQNGKVQAIAAGKATITAKAGGKTATCTVEVTAKPAPEDPEDPEKPEDPENPEDPSDPSNPSDPSEPENPEEPVIVQYTVTYNANGGVGSMSSVTVNANQTITVAANTFTRSGYTFTKWCTDAKCSGGYVYKSGDNLVVTSDITLYAQWDDDANGYEYVDLGLSVRWATMNVRAVHVHIYGGYYSWAEIESKSDYSYSTYTSASKAQDILSSEDVATQEMGGKWRMPTKDEWQELIDNCSWDWTTIKATPGYVITSKINGKTIFLPAAGYYSGTNRENVDEYGCYYSKTSAGDVFNRGWGYALEFDKTSIEVNDVYGFQGYTVRAVLPK